MIRRRSTTAVVLIGSVLCPLALGCNTSETGGPAHSPVTRDSAGIALIRFTMPLEEGVTPIEANVALQVGVRGSGPEGELFRVVGAAYLSDGRVTVANAGTQQIKFFSAAGEFLQAVGRAGDGPEEFRSIAGIRRYRGDSLVAWDRARNRAVILDGEGRFHRAFPLVGPNPAILGSFRDGSLLASSSLARLAGAAAGVPLPQVMDIPRYETTETEPIPVDSGVPNRTLVRLDFPNGGVYIDNEIFGHHTSVAVADSSYYIGLADDHTIRGYDEHGALRSILSWHGVALTVSGSDVEAFKAEAMQAAATDENRQFQRQRLAQLLAATRFPAYADVMADADGRLWIRKYERPGNAMPQSWTVIDLATHVRKRVQFKPSDQVLDVGRGWALVLQRDELGVETVVEYTWPTN